MKKEKIDSNTLIKQRNEIYLTELDEDRVMMDMETGNYYVLNGIGSSIWERIKERKAVNDIVDELVSSYDISFNECEEQVIEYLSKLYEANLVVVEN